MDKLLTKNGQNVIYSRIVNNIDFNFNKFVID